MQERTFKFKGKEYKESELSTGVVNWFILKQEVLNSEVRHLAELEKITVLKSYYDQSIEKGINGGNSKSKS
tara:strand:+ start:1191 stop:1403 length:213 start_codon:yes stop_codon:yes gene_type:complete